MQKTIVLKTIVQLYAIGLCALSAEASNIPCGPNYHPDLTVPPIGAVEIHFSDLRAGEAYALDRSEVYVVGDQHQGFHLNERVFTGPDGQPSSGESKWVCVDLHSNTPTLHESLLFPSNFEPALDGSIYTIFRRYTMDWPDQDKLKAHVEQDATLDPFTSLNSIFAQNWDAFHIYRVENSGLLMTFAKASRPTDIWGAELRVFLNKMR